MCSSTGSLGEIAMGVAVVILIAHAEWRYRCLVRWLDALGEMASEAIAVSNQQQKGQMKDEH